MSRITIDVKRDDGDVTRLRGDSGIATCMGPMNQEFRKSDPPIVSLRCYSEEELAWNLAAVMAAVQHHAPRAFVMAKALMPLCDFAKPQIATQHPRFDPKGP